ncbi:MAG: hypothetical protein ACOYXC_16860 [Candidatus Rifleibacteriota bacterium]
MNEINRVFGRISGADRSLLHLNDTFALRQRSDDEISLFALNGKMLRLIKEGVDSGPDCIVCQQMPVNNENLPEDGWVLEDGVLRIPFLTKIELQKIELFDSVANIEIRDFPGHMKGMIARRLRQADFARVKPVEDRCGLLTAALNEHLTESAEIPLVEVLGFGEGSPSMGDAALCGMLLTGRCFALGRRFKLNWYNRLRVEVRRLLHRTDHRGKNWLSFALDGRMTELQRGFFTAMARDFECADEIVVKKIAGEEIFNGRAFLIGCFAALEMIQKSLYNK